MRLIKLFGLAAMAAVIAMALAGASTAMANGSTAICKVHQDPCVGANHFKAVHFVNRPGTVLGFLTEDFTALCLNVLRQADVLALANPQEVHTTQLTFTGCGTTAAHNNCTFTVEQLALGDLLRTALNKGRETFLSGRFKVKCGGGEFLEVDCEYLQENAETEVTTGKETEINIEEELVEGESGSLCPSVPPVVHLSLVGLDPYYIVS
ncbi:MAG TPA: hypothetical protein VF093_00495 [Solirubrobacterales bacterium]